MSDILPTPSIERPLRVSIYGDSLCKGTVVLEDGHYSFKADGPDGFIERALEDVGLGGGVVQVTNRSRFGCTSEKGQSILARDLKQGFDADICLIAYGGNDSDNDWDLVAREPDVEHPAKVPMERFCQLMTEMAMSVRDAGARPVFMTCPPIDAQRWLAFCCRNGADPAAIEHWLGGVAEMYRFHEWYANAILHLGVELGVTVVDTRAVFLPDRRYVWEKLASDGIHLTEAGYKVLFGTLARALSQALE